MTSSDLGSMYQITTQSSEILESRANLARIRPPAELVNNSPHTKRDYLPHTRVNPSAKLAADSGENVRPVPRKFVAFSSKSTG